MLETRELKQYKIFHEMQEPDQLFWFDYKQKKFLHNIDTFYYSVKLENDFTVSSSDPDVIHFRRIFDTLRDSIEYNDSIPFYVENLGNLNLLNFVYGKYYNICLECPEYFHVFIASKVPPGAGGTESVTSEVIVQIRSYMLWMYGVHEAFRRSMEYVQALMDMFRLRIAYVQENRIDYCWHSNYLTNPEKFFAIDNFYRMRVDRYRGANYHTAKVGSEGYEIDYVSLGNRGGKCFVRIYLKSKEVVEQGYKAFFFKVWLFHGLISRYDLYCYEKAFLERNWHYMTIARLEFYLEFGADPASQSECRRLISQYRESGKVTDSMIALANCLTPSIHLITNVEYQTMRKGTKSYVLLPVRDNRCYGICSRVYDYLDNRSLIAKYLTHDIFRLVEPFGDINKSRRDYCGFWKALRSTKLIDVKKLPDELKLIREYNRRLNKEAMKQTLLHKAVVYGIYLKGINEDSVLSDCMEALLQVNDNDIMNALRYKKKKARQFNASELTGKLENNALYRFVLLDQESGVIYDESSMLSLQSQEWSIENEHDDKTGL